MISNKILIRFLFAFMALIVVLSLYHYITYKRVVQVLIASKNIDMGQSLDQKNLTWENWPKSNIQKHFLVKGSFNEKVLNTVVAARTIIAGEPITGANVIYKKNFNSLNNFLKPGMRAMSVLLPSGTLGGGAFKAGQTIDLNITLSKKGSRDFITQTALCNTRILSIGQNNISSKYSKKADKEDKHYLVILEVTPNQAKSLTTALKMGTPSLVLHPAQKDQEQCVETDFGTEEDSQTVEVIKAG